jgi:hypothetical protein
VLAIHASVKFRIIMVIERKYSFPPNQVALDCLAEHIWEIAMIHEAKASSNCEFQRSYLCSKAEPER